MNTLVAGTDAIAQMWDQVRWIDVDDIVVPASHREIRPEGVEKLIKSFGEVGLLHPIGVDEHNVLSFGGHRLAAFRKLGATRIPATEVSEDAMVWAEFEENETRTPMTWSERSALWDRLQPMVDAAFQERKRQRGLSRSDALWDRSDAAEVDEPKVFGAAKRSADALAELTGASRYSMPKFKALEAMAAGEGVDEDVAREAAEAVKAIDNGASVDGHFKRVTAMAAAPQKQTAEKPAPAPAAAAADKLAFKVVDQTSRLEEFLMPLDPAAIGAALSPAGHDGLLAFQRFIDQFVTAVEAARE